MLIINGALGDGEYWGNYSHLAIWDQNARSLTPYGHHLSDILIVVCMPDLSFDAVVDSGLVTISATHSLGICLSASRASFCTTVFTNWLGQFRSLGILYMKTVPYESDETLVVVAQEPYA